MIVVLGSVICLKKIYNNGIWAYAPLCHCHSNIFFTAVVKCFRWIFFLQSLLHCQ